MRALVVPLVALMFAPVALAAYTPPPRVPPPPPRVIITPKIPSPPPAPKPYVPPKVTIPSTVRSYTRPPAETGYVRVYDNALGTYVWVSLLAAQQHGWADDGSEQEMPDWAVWLFIGVAVVGVLAIVGLAVSSL